MEIVTTTQDSLLSIVRTKPPGMLTLDILQNKTSECVEFANRLIDEIDNNFIQPIHPDYKIQYLFSLKHRLLSILDSDYKFDERRVVNNCKTYAAQHHKFDQKHDVDEWKNMIGIGKRNNTYTGCNEGELAIQNYANQNLSLPRMSLPELDSSPNSFEVILQKLIDDNTIEDFQEHLTLLPNNAYITDPGLNSYLQAILHITLNERKSRMVWRLIGNIVMKMETLENNNGLNSLFVNKDKIDKITSLLVTAQVVNSSGYWIGPSIKNALDKKPATSVYALIQTLYDKGYLKQPDKRSTRKAFVIFFKIDIQENTYARISDLPMFHNDYLNYFRRLIPDPTDL
jgi:hypothetical protein